MILHQFPPMGVYETLFKFAEATNSYMGDPGTHPWAQGYPLTTQLPGGPPLPSCIEFTASDFKYPKATGEASLLEAVKQYYNYFYRADITTDNIAIFAGGRPAIFAILAFLLKNTTVAIEETEYTPYYDIINVLNKSKKFISSNDQNKFRPSPEDYDLATNLDDRRIFLIKSNPCNPTGVALSEENLRYLVELYSQENRGMLFDEAYEFYQTPNPDSALRHIDNIDETNIFVVGAATKGLQVPGMRIGWVVASREHIEVFRNYSSFAMGGVSRASQLYVASLLELERVTLARKAIGEYYEHQRNRYRDALANLGVELFTGNGGFYHWGKLPNGMSGDYLNQKLFNYNAGVLPGRLCDMTRLKNKLSVLDDFIRFSFGPLPMESFEKDIEILSRCIS